jgi:glycosyltransferase involved in cell wall biosynthesis
MLSGGLRTKGIIKQSHENMLLITVVTVVRNGEKTLEETILSVINQTYINIEYIIIDGASIDNTLDIIKKYENRIDYWISESDNGIYYAMNKGIDLAMGEWINFMNSGDKFFNEDTITDIIKIFDNHDIIYGDFIKLNGIRCRSPKKLNMLFFLLERMVCHQALFERRKLLIKYHFDIKYKIVADRKHLIKCYIDHSNIKYIPYIICVYDINGFSSNKNNFETESSNLLYEYYGLPGILFLIIKRFFRKILK